MKVFAFHSIRTQIMTATTLLIVTLVGSIVWVWAETESNLYRQQQKSQAKSLVKLSAYALANELSEDNWSQIRVDLDLLMKENQDFLYILVSDVRKKNQILASSPSDFQNQYIPDIVPVKVTNAALDLSQKSSAVETFALRDIKFLESIRAKRGERIIEVSSDVQMVSGEKIGTLRIGMSLRQINRAVVYAVNQALLVGTVGLFVGLVYAYILAKRLSDPVQRLQVSAARIAAGDLHHRAEINLSDEIGALAKSFNEMSVALQTSFSKLQKTLKSFEHFVPDKFLAVIAPEGIENIQVGVSATRTMTILFCDIRGYSSMAEQMTPQQTFSFLNDFLECMGLPIEESGGFIDKYIGDAIMALFDDEGTDSAVRAAILMQQTLSRFNEARMQKGLPAIAVGIGIHRGEVVMGTVGFTSRIDSTVVGDSVNLASRLEGLTKQYNCNILVTESVVNSLYHPESFYLGLVDKSVKVKGKDEAIAIYEVKI
ncbi:HAMP domain-containing protein [Coleofasciculus sp. FACHB-64]|uniref:adenylate/guanylate cyclase domain-containing protein n=1 Tax=Cyanophyceae TaxID=3028117 RepID=UPI001688CECE|nr:MULTISPECIES: adenylate/guanylate cyclase domain-containing protein [unclassified Coleofasciculus]MBD1838627.1 HAMP domain-containing protein [Coleofasciculus sp. FACHB-501]MBD2045862.1 HAMP domain-containing protein [Coleofasciculus sp. FACHB-64]